MQIIVIGMHRSGTSVVTRILNLMGAYFGPEGISTGANKENPKGFWERRDVRNINDGILHSASADWDKINNFSCERVPDPSVTKYRAEIRALVDNLEPHRPWVIKEPRLCLLLPIWEPLLHAPVYVFAYRNPIQVAQSLQKRNGLPIPYGLALWEKYTLSACQAMSNKRVVTVFHEEIMADPVQATKVLYERLEQHGVSGLHLPSAAEITSFVDPALFRQRGDEHRLNEYANARQLELHHAISEAGAIGGNNFELSRGAKDTLQYHEELRDNLSSLAEKETNLQQEVANQATAMRALQQQKEDELQSGLQLKAAKLKQAAQLESCEQALASSQALIRAQQIWASRLEQEFNAFFSSWRWRIGDSSVSLAERVLLRPRVRIATDNIRDAFTEFAALAPDLTLPTPQAVAHREPSLTPLALIAASVDIVVCVHNALEDVRNCLQSILDDTEQPFGLIIVNDGSGTETTDYLAVFHQEHAAFTTLLHNRDALGYTRAANCGLRESGADYTILLNSDTVVSRLWLQRILECAESHSDIGIVGPLSNAASWQSIPKRFDAKGDWAVNDLPPGYKVNVMGELVYLQSEKAYPRASFINGFCFAIKRKVIERIGYLDEESFPRGYGEENDYCLRALDAGFQLAIADHAYVYHAKSKSFTHKTRNELSRLGGDALKRKHGSARIGSGTKALKENPQLASMRQRIRNALAGDYSVDQNKRGLRVLFVLPVRGGGGGSHSVVQEVVAMRALGVEARIANKRSNEEPFRAKYPDYFSAGEYFLFYRDENELLALSRDFELVVATVYHSVPMLQKVVAAHPAVLPAYYIQDYEPWFFEQGTADWRIAYESYNLIADMLLFAKTDWLCQTISERHGTVVQKVSPSLDTSVFFPGERNYHSTGPVTLSAMIRPGTPRRAPKTTLSILREMKKKYGEQVNILVFGCTDKELHALDVPLDFDLENLGVLQRDAVAEMHRRADIFVDFSDYQAFGRTGLEAMACGSTAILPIRGGVSEYARHEKNALIVDTTSVPEMTNALDRLIRDHSLLRRLQQEALVTAKGFSALIAALSELSLFRSAWARRNSRSKPAAARSVAVTSGSNRTRVAALTTRTADGKPTGSAYVRLLAPLQHASVRDEIELQLTEPSRLADIAPEIVIVQRNALNDQAEAEQVIRYCRSNNRLLCLEIDDDLLNLHNKPGESGLPPRQLAALEEIARSAERIITSAEPLGRALEDLNPRVVVVPNALDEQLWLRRNESGDFIQPITSHQDTVRFIYMGTMTHAIDLTILLEPLRRIKQEYGHKITLDVVGGVNGNRMLDTGLTGIARHRLKHGMNYPAFVQWLTAHNHWDIGLIPLEVNPFNRKKSYIKYLDYAALGIPSICTRIEPYEDAIVDGENGILVTNDDESWYRAMKQLIENREQRAMIAAAAFANLTAKHVLQQRAADFCRAYKTLLCT